MEKRAYDVCFFELREAKALQAKLDLIRNLIFGFLKFDLRNIYKIDQKMGGKKRYYCFVLQVDIFLKLRS